MSFWHPPQIWKGGSCWILGGGQSVNDVFNVPKSLVLDLQSRKKYPDSLSPYMESIHDKHIIGINDAYMIGNWIDVLFFSDGSWYVTHQFNLAKFKGLRISCAPRFANISDTHAAGIKYMQKDPNKTTGITMNRGKVAWNNNSGGACISLSHHFGAKQIFLLGFDMQFYNGQSHWHKSRYSKTSKNPFNKHLKGFPRIASDAEQLGIEIYNLSPKSAITVFPKITLEEALELDERKKTRIS